MKIRSKLTTCSVVILAACAPTVDQALISTQPAAATTISVAQNAVDICSQTPSDRLMTANTLTSNGFKPASLDHFPNLQNLQNRTLAFEAAGGEVLVIVATDGNETACLVGGHDITPEQSFALAQPWVEKFDALTNAERGQGLSNLVVQAWASFTDERNVYISATKTWDVLEGPGSAVRLIYLEK